MNLSRIVRWAGMLLGAATIALAAGAQSPQPQQTQTPTTQPSTTNQQNTATPAQQTPEAQQPEQEPPQATETLQLFSREVDLFFAVTDKHGNFVNGLQQQNFGLLDDGRPPERIIRFVQQTNLPLRVGIMIDTSSSIRQRFAYEQQAAIDFLLQVMHPVDRAFVEGFDVQTDIEQDYTNRVDLLDSGISRLRPGGGTALYDSLYKTCRDQMLTLKQSADVRKMMVLVSDGDDDYSRATEDDAIKMCQRAETIVYTISTNTGPSRDKGDDVLLRISDATGGRAFFPVRMEDVSEGFMNIEAELRSQYSLVYVPAGFKQDGSFRTIYLQSLDPRYVVRAKKGYFAPRPPE
ncbi:VWA domain-containing protein [Granulicella sp. L46]|uniref:VWA domain-containing protein n=1 Tax=Granulicella sp. L46 TaxID=1641865 RepID=UPI0020B11A0E|nr:VWA domain-containing protein [Granulicella sp. L46]